jgi:tetratricopeptide (TPR) repeat protein
VPKQLLLAVFLTAFSWAQPIPQVPITISPELADVHRDCVDDLNTFTASARTPPRICAPHFDEPDRQPRSAGTVSVDRLRHPLPREASKAIEQASRLSQSGRMDQAAEKLRSAADRFTEFWELHYNLGVNEMKLGELNDAAQEFARARELNPRFVAAAVASGYTLLQLRRFDEAEAAAKAALILEPRNQIADLLLGQIRTQQKQAGD